MKQYVIDACAMIAVLQSEAGDNIVLDIIQSGRNGEASLLINKLNLMEVYYKTYRSRGKEGADEILQEICKTSSL